MGNIPQPKLRAIARELGYTADSSKDWWAELKSGEYKINVHTDKNMFRFTLHYPLGMRERREIKCNRLRSSKAIAQDIKNRLLPGYYQEFDKQLAEKIRSEAAKMRYRNELQELRSLFDNPSNSQCDQTTFYADRIKVEQTYDNKYNLTLQKLPLEKAKEIIFHFKTFNLD